MILLLIAIATTLLIYYGFVKPMSYWKDRGVVQGKPVPFFGDTLGVVLRQQSWAQLITNLYKISPDSRYVGVYQMNVPTLLVRDPDLIKKIGIKDFDHFVNHREFLDPESNLLVAKNLFFLKDQAWKDMRNTLTPSFTSCKMRDMFTLIDGVAKSFVKHIKEQNREILVTKIKDLFSRFSNDVIASTAFGITLDSLKDKNNEFYITGVEMFSFSRLCQNLKIFIYLLSPKLSKIFKLNLFPKKFHAFFKNLVVESIKAREEKGIVRRDMIQLLLEARKGKEVEENEVSVDTGFATAENISASGIRSSKTKIEITNDDIMAQAMIFFFAGFDNSSNLMCFMAHELAVNREIQTKLREEIFATLEDNDGKISYEALLKMKYLDMVLSETLRKWPIALVLDRVCNTSYTIEPQSPNEVPVRLVPGNLIWIPAFAIHHDPKYYPNPQKFDPERFSEENVHKINKYAYIPFGVGPRNCIGSRFAILETKLVIFHILANFELVPTEKTSIPVNLSKKTMSLTDQNGFHLGLKALERL